MKDSAESIYISGVAMAVVKVSFWRIDRYVAETTTALQEAAKRLEEKFSGGRHV